MSEEELTNIDIILYVLYLLGGTNKKVFTEDIAKRCFELAPSRFSWKLYPQYPDMDSVRVALFDARKIKSGNLVEGRYGKTTGSKAADGWIFTTNGVAWVKKNLVKIQLSLGNNRPRIPRTISDKLWLERERSSAFKKFIKDGSCEFVKDYEFTDFLDVSLDSPPQILQDRLQEVRVQAADAKKEDMLSFLQECEEKFKYLLGGKNEN